MHHSPYVISEQQYCGRAAHSMSTLYIATPLHLGGSLGLIEQWGLSISDTAPPEHSFIISHVQSVIRPRGGPWMVDFELLSVYCSPASHCEALHCSHPQPPHFLQLWQDCNYDCMNPLCGECVCVWDGVSREPWYYPDLLSSSPRHQQGEGARWRGTKSNVAAVLQGRLAYSSKSRGRHLLRYSI